MSLISFSGLILTGSLDHQLVSIAALAFTPD